MKKVFIWFMLFLSLSIRVEAEEKPEDLYAQSAVLMDADTGRVLFEKDGYTKMAMASTTKIMTCILALEEMQEGMVVTFSEYASLQPKVHLGASAGEVFYIEDLLYSLMLESHNDVAVAIAEAISGSVEAFANKMNDKAKQLGCMDTYFITPNGLDAQDEYGFHSTTAADLARIMSYCIKESPCKEKFLDITATMSHTFTNLDGSKSYSCTNKNAYLSMDSEAISGKTGYTSKAGYCYVGAVESEGRSFVVALLASGWPNHKNYKWLDMKEVISYARENYQMQELDTEVELEPVVVKHSSAGKLFQNYVMEAELLTQKKSVMLGKDEKIEIELQQIKEMEAPVEAGEQIGSVKYSLEGELIAEYPIVSTETAKRIDFFWIFSKIMELYLG